jgi:hypothetical protein
VARLEAVVDAFELRYPHDLPALPAVRDALLDHLAVRS